MAFKKFDFAALDRLTPEEMKAREERRELERGAAEDQKRFKGKPLRTIELSFGGDMRHGFGYASDKYLVAKNERGRIDVSVDHDRSENDAWQKMIQGANRALMEKEDKGERDPVVPMTVTGAFNKRYWNDRDGNRKESWEFKATEVKIKGMDEARQEKEFSAGFPVREKPAPEKQESKEKSDKSKGHER